ncbi:MAG: RHS repeat-associated core domain-containing [Prolixibacteraceae bacterium]|nr:MAG: RHS repeat-associated core domain-containing [Prolixibacteraceae bacterium]
MKTRFSINGTGEILMSGNNYNEAENLATQYLHSVSGGTFLQKNDYLYNIRGWMTQLNNPSSFTENDVFGMKLEYNLASTPLYNGNISKFTWAYSAAAIRTYTFTYDGNNRVTAANFNATGKTGNELDEVFAYDFNGNITKTSRYDYNGVLTDSMKFTYAGNRITGFYDKQGDIASVVDYPGSATSKYPIYDYNGNETTEPHKLLGIGYNMINLPYVINWNGLNRKVSYFYTFDGIKRRKTVEDNGTITKLDYCGPFVYETVSGTRSLKYILTPHGRAVKSGSSWVYN